MTLLKLGQCHDATRERIGGKAFSVNTMLRLELPVPPAFVLSTDECARYYSAGMTLADDVRAGLRSGIAELEAEMGRRFGAEHNPLLVSVRSGAARSMPGMMDTVLNLGINDTVESALRALTGNADYAADTHRRFVEQFRKVVGTTPSADPWEQLEAAVAAVFESWRSPRATAYRRHHDISDDGGTAVTVQAMVFGNLDDRSGTGVLFTRDPITAQSQPFGEWLPGGQGEDVVSGRCTPKPLSHLADQLPEVHAELMAAASLLEHTMRDVQDIEFTVEAGRLWLLQTRSAKRSAAAAVHHAVTFEREGIVTPEGALGMISPDQLEAFLRPHLAPHARATARLLASGEVACPGVASGVVVATADEAEDLADEGVDVILARPTTDPEDVHGMLAATAVITEIGGATSHAAVVSRELNKVCVVGCGECSLKDLTGRHVTVDATSGEVLDGILDVEVPSKATHPDLQVVGRWLQTVATGTDHSRLKAILAEAH
jgi:pyruvate,orthophosphate dikinase